jgi:DNA repair exonuclease SbcCD ATPase subunit
MMMMMIEDFKKDINNSLKEIQENIGKQVELLKEETQTSLRELQENTNIQVKELNETIQDLKMEIETIKTSQKETTLELENLGKRSEVIDVNITNRIQEIEERISGSEDTIETLTEQSKKMQKVPSPKYPGNPGHNDKTTLKDNKHRRECERVPVHENVCTVISFVCPEKDVCAMSLSLFLFCTPLIPALGRQRQADF